VKQLLLVSFFIFYCLFRAAGQEYSWKHYSVGDGLPQTQIYRLYQDSKGYIWIGTKGGLSKFDGIEFKNLTTKDGLSFDFVGIFQEDSQGGMYVGTKRGTNHLKDGKISSVCDSIDPTFGFEFVEKNGTIWFWSGVKGLLAVRDGKQIADHPILNAVEEEFPIGISYNQEKDDIIINYATGDTYRYDGINVSKFSHEDRDIIPRYSDSGQLYGRNSEYYFAFDLGQFVPIAPINDFTLRCYISPEEVYFTDRGTQSRLFIYDGEKMNEFHQRFNLVLDLIKDDEGNIWVATESGLWRLQGRGFQNYLSEGDLNFYAWQISQDKHGNMLFGSFLHGLMTFDGVRFEDVPIKHMFRNNGFQFFYSGNYVDQRGNVYLGTALGILKFDGYLYRWFYKPEQNDAILHIYHDVVTGHLLCTSSVHGLLEIDMEGNVTEYNSRSRRENTGLETSTLRDKFGRIWLSGKQGITILEDGKWRNLPDETDSVPIGAISMIRDSWGNLWLGSNDGLYFYDYKNLKKIGTHIFESQIGILNITSDNELLIGSIMGIGLLDLKEFYKNDYDHIRYFDANNGFLGTECKHNASFKDRDGNIWICTSDRVVKVIPEELRSNPNPPRVYIEDISTIGEKMDWEPVPKKYGNSAEYKFEAHHDDLRFEYHGISHSAPNGVRYQSMLVGYDESWSAPSQERYRTYTNLPEGQYEFRVKAWSNDGVESEFVSVNFGVLPAWHEMSTVRYGVLAILLALAALLGFLYSERIRMRRMTMEQNERLIAQLQFKSLRSLIDPHFTFNAINSIASMVYKENRDEAYKYFTKFSKLIRSAFDTSEDTTRTIREELTFVSNYLDIEKMRFKDRFDYRMEIDKKINYEWKIPKMVIQIYVENAIKHGLARKESGGEISIKMVKEDDFISISVTDNGSGRNETQRISNGDESLGRGTKMMKDYFRLLNKFNDSEISVKIIDLKSKDNQPMGTEVKIYIPVRFRYAI